ncbi:hypothetical protein BKA82DRAFT_4019604 [Pisolithus tinctorius]|nr:hypothetical protein BKA82DRAFT_4019604 [Pisolithus tinctorius]
MSCATSSVNVRHPCTEVKTTDLELPPTYPRNLLKCSKICQAAKEMIQQHIRLLHTLKDNVMTKGFGLIGENMTTPEVKASLQNFLLTMQNQSIQQAMHTMGTREMPLWILDKILEYPNAYDIKVATETECSMYWKQLMSDNVPENPSSGSTCQGRNACMHLAKSVVLVHASSKECSGVKATVQPLRATYTATEGNLHSH